MPGPRFDELSPAQLRAISLRGVAARRKRGELVGTGARISAALRRSYARRRAAIALPARLPTR